MADIPFAEEFIESHPSSKRDAAAAFVSAMSEWKHQIARATVVDEGGRVTKPDIMGGILYARGIDGKPFRIDPPWSRTSLSHSVRLVMRKHPTIKLGLAAVKAPVIGAFRSWTVRGANPEVAGFVRAVMQPIITRVVKSQLKSMEFGYAPHEIVWERRKVTYEVSGPEGVTTRRRTAYVIDDVVDLAPWKVEVFVDPDTYQPVHIRHNGDDNQIVPWDRVHWVTYDGEFGNIFGNSVLDGGIYDMWYWHTMLTVIAMRYFERKGDPPAKARAPWTVGRDAKTGEEVSGISMIIDGHKALRSSGIIVLPAAYDTKTNQPLFEYEWLNDDQRSEMFESYQTYLELRMLRGLLLTDRGVVQDTRVGSFAAARTYADVNMLLRELDLVELGEEPINRLVRQLVAVNFGEEAASSVRIEATLRPRDRADVLVPIISRLLQAETVMGSDRIAALIDVKELLTSLGIETVRESGEPAQAQPQSD